MGTRYIVEGLLIFMISTAIKLYFSLLQGERFNFNSLIKFELVKGNSNSIGSIVQIYAVLIFIEGVIISIFGQFVQYIPRTVMLISFDILPILIIYFFIKSELKT
jgi:hypothetical protein